MKTLIAAAITAALLVGCGRPGPYLSCQDMPTTEDCEAAHEEAVTNGLFLEDGEQVLAALVRPTESRLCNGSDDPLYDVSFDLREHSEPLVVTVGKTVAGTLIVCTY